MSDNSEREKEFLATQVMGWHGHVHRSVSDNGASDIIYWVTDEDDHIYEDDFDPRNNIEQCFMLLDKFDNWSMQKDISNNDYACEIYIEKHETMIYGSERKNLTDAIVDAVLQASGWEGE